MLIKLLMAFNYYIKIIKIRKRREIDCQFNCKIRYFGKDIQQELIKIFQLQSYYGHKYKGRSSILCYNFSQYIFFTFSVCLHIFNRNSPSNDFYQNYLLSQKSFFMYEKRKISFPLLPSMDMDKFPQFNPSMQMINTIKGIKMQSYNNIDMGYNNERQNNNQDSNSQRCSIIQTAMNTSKKKKIGCTCKKTFCLKMYCECFASGKECGDDCMCMSCKNTPQFKQQIILAKNNIKEGGMRNCSLSQKKCNCKKSKCLKKYCECFNAGIGCSPSCKCQDCQNKQQPKEDSLLSNHDSPQQVQPNILELKATNPLFPSLNQYKSQQDVQKYMND